MTDQEIAMRRTGLSIAVIGGLFALTVLPALHPVAHLFLQVAYWPMSAVPAELAVPLPLLVAIGGGLTAGLGGMLWALGTHVAPSDPQAAMRVTQITAWTWFCTDSTGSALAGAPFNVVLNLGFLAAMLFAARPRARNAPMVESR